MVIFDFVKALFRKENSSATAKERLRLVLLSDHLSLAPDVVDALKSDLLDVIARYVEFDPALADVTFEHREHEVAMLASVPIRALRPAEAAAACPVEPKAEPAEQPVDAAQPRPGTNGSGSRRKRRRKSAGKARAAALAASSAGPAHGLPLASHP